MSVSARGPHKMVSRAAHGPRAVVCSALIQIIIIERLVRVKKLKRKREVSLQAKIIISVGFKMLFVF